MIGSAPYSVTKHAAVGFAEWLSVTYGHRGVTVQAICPQGVRTQMLEDAGPAAGAALPRQRARARSRSPTPWSPRSTDDRFLVLPHPEVAGYYAARRQRHRPLAGRHAPAPAQARREQEAIG